MGAQKVMLEEIVSLAMKSRADADRNAPVVRILSKMAGSHSVRD